MTSPAENSVWGDQVLEFLVDCVDQVDRLQVLIRGRGARFKRSWIKRTLTSLVIRRTSQLQMRDRATAVQACMTADGHLYGQLQRVLYLAREEQQRRRSPVDQVPAGTPGTQRLARIYLHVLEHFAAQLRHLDSHDCAEFTTAMPAPRCIVCDAERPTTTTEDTDDGDTQHSREASQEESPGPEASQEESPGPEASQENGRGHGQRRR